MSFDFDSADNLSNAIENNLYVNSHNIVSEEINNYVNFYKWERVAKDYLEIYHQLGYLDG